VATLRAEYPDRAATIVIGMATDKDVPTFIERIRPITKRLIATAARSARATPPDHLAATARAAEIETTEQPTVSAALRSALDLTAPSDSIVVTGSFAVVADARAACGLAKP
jgi:folylpolyglutamate synthase/dihydropteroate synthase